mgnify:CR=1 FL=1
MRPSPFLRRAGGWLATAGAALLAACTSVPLPPMSSPSTPPAPPAGPATAPPPASREATPPATTSAPPRPSEAATPRAYRVDAAAHVYRLNRERIYAGRLPPMLYAIGVLEVDVDARGQVTGLNWRRAPRHAPEVIAERNWFSAWTRNGSMRTIFRSAVIKSPIAAISGTRHPRDRARAWRMRRPRPPRDDSV